MKILIVDDEHDILEFLSYNIKKEGYDVVTADNGKRGYYLAKKHIPNLIILDVMMPQMDGFEVCEKIIEKDELKKSKIIFLSAKSDEKTINILRKIEPPSFSGLADIETPLLYSLSIKLGSEGANVLKDLPSE